MNSITSDQMYRIEDNGHNLIGMRRVYMMENAGHGIADFIVNKFKSGLKDKKIVALCGTGNNGGDGFVASRHLTCYYTATATAAADITVILFGLPSSIRSEEAHINWKILEKMDSIKIIFGKDLTEDITAKITKADIIIDGIFGTGIKGEIRYPNDHAIDLINSSRAYVVSIDVPSGLDPNTGRVHDKCVKADATVTFHRMKKGLLRNKKYTGIVHLECIGIPPEAERGVL
jgi:NAD(P)H-hydrate epimerase